MSTDVNQLSKTWPFFMAISTWQSLNPSTGCQPLGSSALALTTATAAMTEPAPLATGTAATGTGFAAQRLPRNTIQTAAQMAGRWLEDVKNMEDNLKMDEVFGVICSMNFSDKHLR